MMIALHIEDVLGDAGYEVVGPAMRLDQAIELVKNEPVDLALLDVNLGGDRSFPAADLLTEKGVPVIFLTGYGAHGLEDRFKSAPTINKPFEPENLAEMVTEALG